MRMFEQSTVSERNPVGDWAVRGGIALFFIVFGLEKFDPESDWVSLFQQIGIGQWFRYFTGVVEVVGGVLVVIPRTVTAGLALLACTMLTAALLWIFVLGRPGNAVFAGTFLAGLVGCWWTRRSR